MKRPDVNKPNEMGQSLKDLAIEKLIVELNEDGFDKAGVNHHVRGFLLGVKWLLSLQPEQPEAGEEDYGPKPWFMTDTEWHNAKVQSQSLPTPGTFNEDDMREAFGAGVDHQNLPWKYDNWEKFITEYKKTKS